MNETLTHARLLQVLRYDPDTGLFWWLERAPKRNLSKPAGSTNSGELYVRIGIDGQYYRAHRLAWYYMTGAWPTHEVDHEDRNKKNNKWLNLRPATHKQNAENTAVRSHSKSGVKGVHYDSSRGLWQAYINHFGTRRHLGRFATLKAAQAARQEAESKLFTHAK
jgi:hypothetical protein